MENYRNLTMRQYGRTRTFSHEKLSCGIEMRRSEELFCRLDPRIRDYLMSGRCRMNTICSPVSLRSTRERLVENVLERDMDGIELFCQFRDDFSPFYKFRHKKVPAVDIRTNKRIHQNKLDLRKSFTRPGEKLSIKAGISGNLNTVIVCEMMPGIIDPDQDAEDIRGEIDAVGFPAGIKINDAVSADPAVDEIPFDIGSVTGEFGSHHSGISRAESHIVKTCTAAIVPAAVSNRIPLK